tara:strand:+ start:357 stop:983 length:627 start_codon:yes stop_codon:yes gene_type:complete
MIEILALAILSFVTWLITDSIARNGREIRERARRRINANIETIERKISKRVEFKDLKDLKQQTNSLLDICKSYQRDSNLNPSLDKEINNLERKVDEYISIIEDRHKAKVREDAKDYEAAIILWENLGEIKEAARVRTLQAELGAIKVAQKVVQGDEVTEIKDSVLNRSNIGSSGDDKIAKLEKIANLKKEGLIDDDEFKLMKKEILGK